MLTRTQVEAAADAAFHSLWITALALALALLMAAHRVGADDSPVHLWVFVKANYFQVLCAEIIAPGIRASIAAHQTKGSK